MKKIVIDPVTRIEGHAKVAIYLNEQGEVADSRISVTQLRGFEAFCVGRPFTEMPSLTARTCGICPVSHLVASSKACDMILAVRPPVAGRRLRAVINLAQIVQSHALSFFHLSSPDLLLGFDAPVEQRNIFGLMQSHPDIARRGIELRSFGQRVIETLGGKRIHPGWLVPGGVSHPISDEQIAAIRAEIPQQLDAARRTIDLFKKMLGDFNEEIRTFANFPTLFMSLVGADGELNFYDGTLRVVDAGGKIIEEGVDGRDYARIIGEASEHDSYLKSPYYKPMGYPEGVYRVGTLARMNVIDRCGTPAADEELAEFRALSRGPVLSSFYYHYARLIEMIHGLEKIDQLLSEEEIRSDHVRSYAQPNRSFGIGVSEAPRGTLIHHYEVDKNGLLTDVNLIIATGNNNLAMNHGVLQVARRFVDPGNVTEGALNRVEAVIRAFDPCLSCSTHAFGRYPMSLEIIDATGRVLNRTLRGVGGA